MEYYEEKMREYIDSNGVDAEHLIFAESCHSVEEAARAVNSRPEDFVKSICLTGSPPKIIIAIVKGEDKVSRKKVADALGIEMPVIAKPEDILEKTGYPAGGVPPIGFDGIFLIDERVMNMDSVYAGGGSANSLIYIKSKEIKRMNNGKVCIIRK